MEQINGRLKRIERAAQLRARVLAEAAQLRARVLAEGNAKAGAERAVSRHLRAPGTARMVSKVVERTHPQYMVVVSYKAQNGIGAFVVGHVAVIVRVNPDGTTSSPDGCSTSLDPDANVRGISIAFMKGLCPLTK